MDESQASSHPKDVVIDDRLLKKTFLDHLNYIYYGKQHLITFFVEIKGIASLNVLKMAIEEANGDAGNQMLQIERIFNSIGENPSKTSTLGIKAMTLEAYLAAIKAGKTALEKDIYILFYLQQIEGIEITYYKVLKNLARSIGYSDTFVNQPFELAVDNKIMFESIYNEYIN